MVTFPFTFVFVVFSESTFPKHMKFYFFIQADVCLTYENKSAMEREATKWQVGRDIWWQVGETTGFLMFSVIIQVACMDE